MFRIPRVRLRTATIADRRRRRVPGFRPVESLEDRNLLTAGAPDTSFGGNGMVTTAIG